MLCEFIISCNVDREKGPCLHREPPSCEAGSKWASDLVFCRQGKPYLLMKGSIMDNLNNDTSEIIEDTETTKPAEVTGEAQITETEEPKKNNNYPTQMALTIRGIVGAYVIYLAYQLMTSKDELTALMWAAVVLFIVAGSGLVILSLKHYITGEYEGGKKDV